MTTNLIKVSWFSILLWDCLRRWKSSYNSPGSNSSVWRADWTLDLYKQEGNKVIDNCLLVGGLFIWIFSLNAYNWYFLWLLESFWLSLCIFNIWMLISWPQQKMSFIITIINYKIESCQCTSIGPVLHNHVCKYQVVDKQKKLQELTTLYNMDAQLFSQRAENISQKTDRAELWACLLSMIILRGHDFFVQTLYSWDHTIVQNQIKWWSTYIMLPRSL